MKKILTTLILFALAILPLKVLSEAGPLIYLEPVDGNFKVGQEFELNIWLDTGNFETDGVDIHYLNFNPEFLEILDVKAGSLYPLTMTNQVDPVLGRIDFSQITLPGNRFKGSGILATLTFKANKVGKTSLWFDFVLTDTTDTNLASFTQDVLAEAKGTSLNLETSTSAAKTTTVTYDSSKDNAVNSDKELEDYALALIERGLTAEEIISLLLAAIK